MTDPSTTTCMSANCSYSTAGAGTSLAFVADDPKKLCRLKTVISTVIEGRSCARRGNELVPKWYLTVEHVLHSGTRW